MRIRDLIFVGLNGYALALHRDTGEIVWSNNELKSGYVTMLLDGEEIRLSPGVVVYVRVVDGLITGQPGAAPQ